MLGTRRLLASSFCTLFRRSMAYSVQERGLTNTLEYRIFLRDASGRLISPFHDIPLFADRSNGVLNMVTEVPRWTNAKMEIATKDRMNPIKQDVKKGRLRFVANCFPHKGYIWNYGAFPQTWEDPSHRDENTGCTGDNDPLDVCEIGFRVATRGEVKQVKVLGVLAMIDEGETDWKIIAIDVNDPLAEKLNDIEDVEKVMPGFLTATRQWFEIYKMPDGKPPNKFAFNGEFKNRAFAMALVDQTYKQWERLVKKETENNGGLCCDNTTLEGSQFALSAENAEAAMKSFPEPGQGDPIPAEVDRWHYVSA